LDVRVPEPERCGTGVRSRLRAGLLLRLVPMRDPKRDPTTDADDVPDELEEAARQELEYPADESDEG
jgi:hypothetical protein